MHYSKLLYNIIYYSIREKGWEKRREKERERSLFKLR